MTPNAMATSLSSKTQTLYPSFNHHIVIDNKSEMKAALWKLPLVDETQPPSQSAAPGHPRSLYKLCDLDNNGESMKRYMYFAL